MTAGIKVYADDATNRLLFDSSVATIPTLFKTIKFTLNDIQVKGSGFSSYGYIPLAGLDPLIHMAFATTGYDDEMTETIYHRSSRNPYVTIVANGMTFHYQFLRGLQVLEQYARNHVMTIRFIEVR